MMRTVACLQPEDAETTGRHGLADDGAVVLRQVLDPIAVDAVAACLARGLRHAGLVAADGTPVAGGLTGRGWDDPRWLQLQSIILADPSVATLREDAGLVAALRAIAGQTMIGGHGDIVRVAFPRQPHLATRPHQDGFYIPNAAQLLTVWIPLGPCPIATGPLAVVPASHLDGLRPHRVADIGVPELDTVSPPNALDARVVAEPWWTTDMWPGDALIFTSSTIHAALPNTTERTVRVSIDLRFRPDDGAPGGR